jgi:hypothetical protein
MMTAANHVIEGMSNKRESALLSAAAETVVWKHALESADGPRLGQRVILYPSDLPQLKQVLTSGDPNVDEEQGHPIAYTTILFCQPLFRHG